MKAFLAYYSDYILGYGGVPVSGAAVSCYPASAFAVGTLPVGGTPGVAATLSGSTDPTGLFTFPGVPPDDYHLLIQYTPPGGAPIVVWRYFVPIHAADAIRRIIAAPRAACLPLTLARLSAGASVTLFCLGDDSTVGYNATGVTAGGWVALLAQQLASLYAQSSIVRQDPTNYAATVDGPIPGWSSTVLQSGSNGQTITLVNAGVKGDTVLRALRRFANLTASWPAADCLIVALGQGESLSSDQQRYVLPADLASHLESLVNVARTLTSAELLLCTPFVSTAGNLDSYADAVRSVAARTRADLCDLRQLWLDRYVAGGPNAGYDPWLNTGVSGLFPTDQGHAAIAAELAKHFTPSLALPYAAAPYGAGKVYELVRMPYSSSQVALNGAGWAARSVALAALNSSGGSFDIATNHAGDLVTVKGRFVDLSMLCRRFSDCGQLGVSVDGGTQATVDLYRGYPTSTTDLADANGAQAPQDRVLLAHGLSDTVHTVVVTLLASKNPLSSGTNWRLESLELGRWRKHGYEVEADSPQTRVQAGAVAVPVAAASSGFIAVTFPTPFPAQSTSPTVVATCQDAAYYAAASGVSVTGFTIVAVRRDGASVTATPVCSWIAIG